jgi:exo-beta-1,3-glucanase (GH17 family)
MRLFSQTIGCHVAGILLCAAAVCTVAPVTVGEAADHGGTIGFQRQEPFVERPFDATEGGRWIGSGVAYGPFRDGQSPGGPAPSRAELLEDLELMARHWSLLRLYGASGVAGTVLELIQERGIDMKVMLGAWIEVEAPRETSGEMGEDPAATEEQAETEEQAAITEASRQEIVAAIRLARAFSDIVVAVNVGNETQVSWSSHPVPPALVIDLVREVRAGTTVPVTVADDWSFWVEPESRVVAREVDFIVAHMHPLWAGQQLGDALDWTRDRYAQVAATHPDRTVVIGETGWATRKHDVGEQATLILGEPGEAEQAIFHDALTAWVTRERIPTFFFEAFDENWKGGDHPDEVEKHWGLFRADRTPKRALSDGARHRR